MFPSARETHYPPPAAARARRWALRRAASVLAVVAVGGLVAACAGTAPKGPTTLQPVSKGEVFLDDGVCFERNIRGRPVMVDDARCAALR